jgi:ATP-binding cassette, subfamily B, bacterial IrtA/YbtP
MARGIQRVILRSFGARDHTATVVKTVYIAPHFARVRMVSPTLFDDVQVEPAAWLRFWFPDPNGSNIEFQRAYTISGADVPAGRFAVDTVPHDPAGPASLRARTVTRHDDRGHVTDGFGAFQRARRATGRLSADR